MSAEAPAADDQRSRDEEARQEAPPDPRERLLALPGIIATPLPNRESLDRLQKFLQENQPFNPQQVNCNLKNKELHIDWQNDLIGANFKNIRLAFAGGIHNFSLAAYFLREQVILRCIYNRSQLKLGPNFSYLGWFWISSYYYYDDYIFLFCFFLFFLFIVLMGNEISDLEIPHSE